MSCLALTAGKTFFKLVSVPKNWEPSNKLLPQMHTQPPPRLCLQHWGRSGPFLTAPLLSGEDGDSLVAPSPTCLAHSLLHWSLH